MSIGASLVNDLFTTDDVSAGIGYQTVKQLALHHAKVYMAARSESKARAAIEKLHADNPSVAVGSVVWLPFDLLDPAGIVKAAKTVSSSETKLNILGRL